MTFLNGIKIYGKNINQLNEDERSLLMVDCMLGMMLNNFNPNEMDDEMKEQLVQLTVLRGEISFKCVGIDAVLQQILSFEKLTMMVEESVYSFDKFVDSSFNLANLMVILNGNVNLCEN